MTCNEYNQSACNIARSLCVVGDRWTLMIMNEIRIGVRRFDPLQARIGISSHLLAARLRKLEETGIIERRVYSNRPIRYEYLATSKGRDLDQVLLSLKKWSLRWYLPTNCTTEIIRPTQRSSAEFVGPAWNASRGALFCFDDCIVVLAPRWEAERAANVRAFCAAKHLRTDA